MDRNIKIDNLKLFLIFCVAMGHLGNSFASVSYGMACIQFWVYLFHMPAFIFVSGLFSKKTVNEKRWNKIVPYLLLYILMQLIEFGVKAWINKPNIPKLDLLHVTSLPWYALAMFWWYLMTIVLRKFRAVYVIPIALIISLASGYFDFINSFLSIQRTIIFFPFFYLGYATDVNILLEKLSMWYIKVISFCVLVSSAVITILWEEKLSCWRILFRARVPYSKIGENLNPAWGWSWRLIAYAISFALTLAIISLMPLVGKITSWLGRRTLSGYVFHNTIFTIVLSKFPEVSTWITGGSFIFRYIIFAVAVLLFTALPICVWPLKKLMAVKLIPTNYE